MKLPPFHLRELLWLALLLAAGIGWWMERLGHVAAKEERNAWRGWSDDLAGFLKEREDQLQECQAELQKRPSLPSVDDDPFGR